MNIALRYIVFAFVVALVSCKGGQKTTGGRQGDADIEPDQLRPQLDTRFQEKYFEAQKFKALGQVEKAYAAFNECLTFEPNEPSVHYELARIDKYIYLNPQGAQAHIKKCLEANANNPWYQRMQAEIYMDAGKYEQAAKGFNTVHTLNPDDQNALYDEANAWMNARNFEKAITVFDEIEKTTGVYEELSFQKHQLYLEMDQVDKAGLELERLAESMPTEARFWGLVAQFYLEYNQPVKAETALQKMVAADPENGQVHYQLSEIYARKGDDEKSFDELKKAFNTTDVTIDQKIAVLMRYYQASEVNPELLSQAYQLIDITIAKHPKEAKAYSIQGDFYYRDRNDAKALTSFKKALEFDQTKLIIWEQTLSLELGLNKTDELIADGERAIELFPNAPQLYLFTGFGYEKQKNYEEAIYKWNIGKELVVDNQGLLAQFYSSLGTAYHKAKNYPKSDESFEKALLISPSDALILNNYAYYLSLRKAKLEKALQMIKQANDIKPNNPTFMDTYGWVLFQMQRYQEALPWSEKAVSLMASPDGESLEHYGDILFMNGKVDEAVTQWNNAKNAGGTSSTINQKIANKKIDN